MSHVTAADRKKRSARGRPPGNAATAHDAILDAVQELLQQKTVRDLTIEEIAKRAGVGKPTIYRWWPSKAALVMDMFEERVAAQFRVPEAATAEATIRGAIERTETRGSHNRSDHPDLDPGLRVNFRVTREPTTGRLAVESTPVPPVPGELSEWTSAEGVVPAGDRWLE